MFFWFLGLSFALVLVVFSTPALDYRLVMFGAVLPVVEGAIGGPWILHTLLGAVVVLTVVMVATVGRRLLRRQLLGLPIGLFVHLVLDATWASADLFWWPFLGAGGVLGTDGSGVVAEVDRSPAVVIVLELVGVAILTFLGKRLDLTGEGRERFMTTGQLLRKALD